MNYRRQVVGRSSTLSLKPANPKDGSEKRRECKLSEEESKVLQWAKDTFGADEVECGLMMRITPDAKNVQAGFFSDAAIASTPQKVLPLSAFDPNHFYIPIFVLDKPVGSWLAHDFVNHLCSRSRFPKFDNATKVLAVDPTCRQICRVECTEVMIATLWGALCANFRGELSSDFVVIIARTISVYLNNYCKGRLDKQEFVRRCGTFNGLIQNRDRSFGDAETYKKFLTALHPADYYGILLQNFEATTRDKIPTLFHVVLGLACKPEGSNVYGMRELVLSMLIERSAKYMQSVSIKGVASQDAYAKTVIDTASESLIPQLQQWAFIMDVLTVITSVPFMKNPAVASKQIAMYREYHSSKAGKVSLREAMEELSPSAARLTVEQLAAMFVRAAASHAEFHATEIFQPAAKGTVVSKLLEAQLQRQETMVAEGRELAKTFRVKPEEVSVPFGPYETHRFSSTFSHRVCLHALNNLAANAEKELFDKFWHTLCADFIRHSRGKGIWDNYNDENKNKNLPFGMKPLPKFQSLDEKEEPKADEKIPENVNILTFLENVIQEGNNVRSQLFGVKECCVCLSEDPELVRCCKLSEKHTVCWDCFPMIRAGNTCTLCRSPVE